MPLTYNFAYIFIAMDKDPSQPKFTSVNLEKSQKFG